MRIFMPVIFEVLFLGWLVYRLFIKKDLTEHLNELYLGLFFTAVWVIIYGSL